MDREHVPPGDKNSRGDEANPRNSLSLRTFGVVVLAAICLVAAVGLALEMFVADRIPALTRERLAEAESLWQRNQPENYDLNLAIRGERPGPVHVEVRGGEVVAMTRDGRTPDQRTWRTWSVPGQFEMLEREIVLAEDPQHEANMPAGADAIAM